MPHSLALVHLSGPLRRRVTCCIDRPETGSGAPESRVPSCTFGGEQAQTAPFGRNPSRNSAAAGIGPSPKEFTSWQDVFEREGP